MITLNSKNINQESIDRIKEGSVFIVLTDTIYGLSCVFNNKESLKKIKKIKKIDSNRPFVVLVSDFKMLKKYFLVSNEQELYIKNEHKKNDRPLSFILRFKKSSNINPCFDDKDGIAVRLPKVNFLTKMINEVGVPIVSTSCNITGYSFLNNRKDIELFFKNKKDFPDFFIKNNNQRPRRRASRIIDIRDVDNVKIIRD
ncbi:MAG: Sua5/YciO/YrdC/YwlC family protein [Patescibacteria group bacterium]